MPLYGNGVTKNFLAILEHEVSRTAKSLLRVLIVIGLLSLLAFFALHSFPYYGFASFLGLLAASIALGVAWAKFLTLESYEVSIRDHWNRWMRYSVSCRTVRECYAKVHNRDPGPSWWVGGLLLTLLILAHAVLGLLALNEAAGLQETLPIFALDAIFLGFMAGKRYLERQWYQKFLHSVNEMLRDGAIGLWGVY